MVVEDQGDGVALVVHKDGYREHVKLKGGVREGLGLGEQGAGVALYNGGGEVVRWSWRRPGAMVVSTSSFNLMILDTARGSRGWVLGDEGCREVQQVKWWCQEGVLVPKVWEGVGRLVKPLSFPDYIPERERAEYMVARLEGLLEQEGRRERWGERLDRQWLADQRQSLGERGASYQEVVHHLTFTKNNIYTQLPFFSDNSNCEVFPSTPCSRLVSFRFPPHRYMVCGGMAWCTSARCIAGCCVVCWRQAAH